MSNWVSAIAALHADPYVQKQLSRDNILQSGASGSVRVQFNDGTD